MRSSAFLFTALALSISTAWLGTGCGQEGVNVTTGSAGGGQGGSGAGGHAGTTGGGSQGGGGDTGLPTSGIRVIIEPNGNDGSELVSAIQNAKTSVHMTMYILSDSAVINALIQAKQAGRDVKVVLDQAMPSGGSSNIDEYNQLKSAGVPVVWASSMFTYTHEKCVVIDGKEAWIMTMNSAYSSPRGNREYLAIDDIADHVAEAEAIFEGDFAGTPPATVDGPLVVAPINAAPMLQGFVDTAKSTLDVEAEEFSDSDLVDHIVEATHVGVKVRIVLSDLDPTEAGTTAINRVKAAGVDIRKLANPYVHAKLLVVDKTSAYVGSANFTFYSETANRELGVLFAVKTEIDKIGQTFEQDFASATAL